MVLVYDVSRWGRFQDADESAYYEYICRRAGIAVQYSAEQCENDGSPVSTIVKGVKHAMAGEYSRELSTKVIAGQRTTDRQGLSPRRSRRVRPAAHADRRAAQRCLETVRWRSTSAWIEATTTSVEPAILTAAISPALIRA
jgi:DNA invertase Pin-like site-specific DNA recombinase